MATRARADLNLETLTMPATKAAGLATIVGEAQYPFEIPGLSGKGSWGGANVFLYGDTVEGDTITVKTYVSFGGGDSWVQVDEDGMGHNDTFTAGDSTTRYRHFYIPMAPRVRVSFVFDEAAVLVSGHGCNADIECLEYEPESSRTLFQNVIALGDTVVGDSLGTHAYNGDTLAWDNPSKVLIWCLQAKASALINGDTCQTYLEGSIDAENWWTIQELTTAHPSTGDSVYASVWEEVERPDFPKYGRISFHGDSVASWTTGNGIKFYVLAIA